MPLPPDYVRPGFVVHAVLLGRAPLRVYETGGDGHRQTVDAGRVTQAAIVALHNEYKIRIAEENSTRGRGQDRLRGMTYFSWTAWAHKAVAVGLLRIVGSEPLTDRAGTEFLQRAQGRNGPVVVSDRVVVALTPRGRVDLDAWASVTRAYGATLGTGTAPALVQVQRRGRPASKPGAKPAARSTPRIPRRRTP